MQIMIINPILDGVGAVGFLPHPFCVIMLVSSDFFGNVKNNLSIRGRFVWFWPLLC